MQFEEVEKKILRHFTKVNCLLIFLVVFYAVVFAGGASIFGFLPILPLPVLINIGVIGSYISFLVIGIGVVCIVYFFKNLRLLNQVQVTTDETLQKIRKLKVKNKVVLLVGCLGVLFGSYGKIWNLDSLNLNPNIKNILNNTQTIRKSHPVTLQDLPANIDKNNIGPYLGLINRKVISELIKTKDGNYVFLDIHVGDTCTNFCPRESYVLDVKNKILSEINIDDVSLAASPAWGSVIMVNVSGSNMTVFYDVAIDRTIDKIDSSNILNYYFLENNTYLFQSLNGDITYRNIETQTNTFLARGYSLWHITSGNFKDFPYKLFPSENALYAFLYVNKTPQNDPDKYPLKDDPVQLVRFDTRTGEQKIVTSQLFNFPFYFNFFEKDTILVGGGRDNGGTMTYPTYLVNRNTGESKMIYYGYTYSISVDEIVGTIVFRYNDSDPNLSTTLDLNGNFLSGKPVQIPSGEDGKILITKYIERKTRTLIEEKLVNAKLGDTLQIENVKLTLKKVTDMRCTVGNLTCDQNRFILQADLLTKGFERVSTVDILPNKDMSFSDPSFITTLVGVKPLAVPNGLIKDDQYQFTFSIKQFK